MNLKESISVRSVWTQFISMLRCSGVWDRTIFLNSESLVFFHSFSSAHYLNEGSLIKVLISSLSSSYKALWGKNNQKRWRNVSNYIKVSNLPVISIHSMYLLEVFKNRICILSYSEDYTVMKYVWSASLSYHRDTVVMAYFATVSSSLTPLYRT